MRILIFLLVLVAANTHAYVNCTNVTLGALGSANGATFHNLNLGGAQGKVIFLSISPSSCTVSAGEDISKGIYLVIDDIENRTATDFELKKFWSSVLLTQKAAGRKIDFHATFGGLTSAGIAVVEPYFINAQQMAWGELYRTPDRRERRLHKVGSCEKLDLIANLPSGCCGGILLFDMDIKLVVEIASLTNEKFISGDRGLLKNSKWQ